MPGHDEMMEWEPSGQTKHRLAIAFDTRPIKDEAKSLEAGRPIFNDVDFIRIQVPGDRNSIIHRALTQEDRRKFGAQYADWKKGQLSPTEGTPIAEWPGMAASQVAELAAVGIRTVEHLAELSDGNAMGLGNVQALRRRAQEYVKAGTAAAPGQQMAAELAKRDNEIEVLRRQVAMLAQKAGGTMEMPPPVEKPAPKRRGRPPKVKPEAAGE